MKRKGFRSGRLAWCTLGGMIAALLTLYSGVESPFIQSNAGYLFINISLDKTTVPIALFLLGAGILLGVLLALLPGRADRA